VALVALVQITLLGGFEIAAEASRRPIEITAKKTRALLAYLALPAGRPRSRDEVADLLWSDRGEKQARASLRQSLGELRKSFEDLGDSPLILEHDKVALDAALVDVDVGTLVKLATSDNVEDLRRAARIYSGDLFHGFDIGDPAYADWLRAERGRLRATAIGILKRLLEREAGQAAVAAGRRLLELDPMDEDAHRSLMRRYADAGEIGAALRQYEKCREILRSELATQPSPETEALHQKIRDRTGAPAAQPERSSDAVRHESAEAAPASKPSIGVLPFANLSGEADQQQLTDGITNDLIADLSRFSSLLVKRARRRNVEAREAGQELGVQYLLEGSVQRDRQHLRINAQLIDAATEAHLWAKRFDREATGLFAIQDEVVETIVAELAAKLDLVERDRARRKTSESLSAYDLWLQARDYLYRNTKEDNTAARLLLERAVALDPSDPRYAADLALSYHYESRWGWSDSQDKSLVTAEELARKGVRLDDSDYRTHWVLATVLRAKSDFRGAQAAYERAYVLNPNDADLAADFGGFHLYYGEPHEAIRRIQSAMQLNPLYPDWYLRVLGLCYFCIGDYTKTIDVVHGARQPQPGLLRLLTAAHIMLDQVELAEAARAEMIKLEPWFTISILRKGLPFKIPGVGAPFFAALRKAGLPE
jgi:DNA-binding SARP family transcriptional activator